MKSLQKRILQFFIFLLLLVCTLFFLFFTFYFSRANSEKIRSYSSNLCDSITYNLDTEVQLLNDISLETIYYIYQKHQLLSSASKDLEVASMLNIHTELSRILGPSLSAGQINIYLNNGLCIGNGFDTKCVVLPAETLPYYEKAVQLGGSKYITRSETIAGQPNTIDHPMILARTFQSAAGNISGIVEVIQNERRFFGSLQKLENGGEITEILIFDRMSGDLIYPVSSKTGMTQEGMAAYYGFVEDNEPLSLSLFTNNITQDKNLAIYDNLESYPWSVLILQPKNSLTLPFYQELFKLMLFLLACFIPLLIIYGIFTRRILSPLKVLKENVDKINIDTLLNDSVTFFPNQNIKTPEIKVLNDTFENMYYTLQKSTNEILVLKEKDSNASFRALQALTDPHFIYNSIATISAMAENGRTDEILSFSRNLCDIIRYTSNRTLNQVTLREELYITQQYLECMKLRYGNDLQYTIQVPECLHHIEIPKLTIQTLVENCIKHGFEITPPLCITVTGEALDDRFSLSVSDNGIGMDNEMREELLAAIEAAIAKPDALEPCIGGSGLTNVFLRMHLKNQRSFYGITNKEPHGCTITIGQFNADCWSRSEQ